MLASLANIFRIPDLRKKVIFTLTIIALYQFGANVPVPFINFSKVAQLQAASKNSGVLGFLNLFSGGALTRMAVFGLGIMPYITSSIIIQLLATVIPKLEQWRDQGAVGQKKLTQTTRYLTVALALMQATGLVYLFHKGGGGLLGSSQNIDLILNYSIWRAGFIVLTLTAGTAFVMWLAELITQRGIGQGMSILIFANVVAGIPSGLNTVLQEGGKVKFVTILLVSLALLVLIVFVDQGQRRIPVTFAKRVVGRKMYGGSNTYIPLKVNQAGVIPVIFASSLLYIPQLAASLFGNQNSPQGWVAWVDRYFAQTDSALYMVIFFLLIIGFTYFYVSITFNPTEVADNMKKYGGFIPGIRPGRPTAEYLNYVLTRLTAPGSLYLATIGLIPMVAFALMNVSNEIPFGGTSLLIMVGVGLDTVKQIESQLQQRNYEGFLR